MLKPKADGEQSMMLPAVCDLQSMVKQGPLKDWEPWLSTNRPDSLPQAVAKFTFKCRGIWFNLRDDQEYQYKRSSH